MHKWKEEGRGAEGQWGGVERGGGWGEWELLLPLLREEEQLQISYHKVLNLLGTLSPRDPGQLRIPGKCTCPYTYLQLGFNSRGSCSPPKPLESPA